MTDLLNFLGWYLTITVIGLAALPIAFRFFPNLTSKGFAFARPLGLLIWGFFFWLLCSLGILQNNTGGVLMAFAILIAFSVLSSLNGRWGELKGWLKANVKTIVSMEVLFFLAFAFWTFIRAANPDVTYTEKPMELAFINAILKSPEFPPLDPWLSGYAISYYYFGYVIISMLIRVTGVISSVGFNLTASLWFALTALAVYGIVFDLLAARKRKEDCSEEDHLIKSRLASLLGPLFVLIVSCLEGVLEFFYAWGLFWKPDAAGNLTSKFWSWLAISELNVAPVNGPSWFPSRPGSWLWWRGSRVIQDLGMSGNNIEVIDEFPFFSYLLADLHPHVLAMPFGLLAIALCLNLFLGKKEVFSFDGPFFQWLKKIEFWLTALVLGNLAFINTWDFPIYVGLFCIVIIYKRIVDLGWSWQRAWEFIKLGIFIGIAGVFIYLPFYIGFSSQAGGLLPSMEFMTRGIHFWILFGALLIPIVIWLVWRFRETEKPRGLLNGLKIGALIFLVLFLVSMLFGILVFSIGPTAEGMLQSDKLFVIKLGQKLSTAYQLFSGLHQNYPVSEITAQAIFRRLQSPGTWLTLLLMFSVVWALLFGKKKSENELTQNASSDIDQIEEKSGKPEVFVYILLLVGIALTVFPEFFYLRDQFGTRMNTVFKFYFQAWIMWGIAAAFASTELLAGLKEIKKQIFGLVLFFTIVCGLAYPFIMLGAKTNNFNPTQWTLDGNAYLAIYDQDDYLAIQFLQDKPLGVVAEAIGGSYSPEYAKVSARSGMPTVLGWPGHEGQWRGGYTEVGSRESDIKLLYSTQNWDEAQSIIERYNIRYIYLGNTEKDLYNTDGLMLSEHLSILYQNNSVTIFEVPAVEGEGAE